MHDVIFVAGARPNFMKIAPILRGFAQRQSLIRPVLVHTGQHYDVGLSEIFLQQLGIAPPNLHLNVGSGSHGAQTAAVLAAFERHLLSTDRRPRGVVVVGDVNSTIAASLAAVKLGIPVAHVEAGLRSFDRTMPEEINRVLTDAIAEILLVSEPAGLENLRREGLADEQVHHVGNVMIDTLVHELPQARAAGFRSTLGLPERGYALVTLHRPSNVDDRDRLAQLVEYLHWLAERLEVVFPIHPRTRARLVSFELMARVEQGARIRAVEPLGYHETLGLMEAARCVITDSGGIQEETTYLGVPCLTLRPNTERPVTVTQGTNTVVGDDLERARMLVEQILRDDYKSGSPVWGWDGNAASRIIDVLTAQWS